MRRIGLLLLGLCLTVGVVGCEDDTATDTDTTTTTPETDTTTDTDADTEPDATDEDATDPAVK